MFYYLCKVIRYVSYPLSSHTSASLAALHQIVKTAAMMSSLVELEGDRAACPRADAPHCLLAPWSSNSARSCSCSPSSTIARCAPPAFASSPFQNHFPPPNQQTAPPQVSSIPPMPLTKPSDRRRPSVELRRSRPRTWSGGSCFGASWGASRCGNSGPNGASVGESLGKGRSARPIRKPTLPGCRSVSVHLDEDSRTPSTSITQVPVLPRGQDTCCIVACTSANPGQPSSPRTYSVQNRAVSARGQY